MQARVAFILTIFLLLTSLVMSKQEQEKIAIIGGGASGIACAYLLKKNGYKRVTILEADRSVGGAIKSIKVDKKSLTKQLCSCLALHYQAQALSRCLQK